MQLFREEKEVERERERERERGGGVGEKLVYAVNFTVSSSCHSRSDNASQAELCVGSAASGLGGSALPVNGEHIIPLTSPLASLDFVSNSDWLSVAGVCSVFFCFCI